MKTTIDTEVLERNAFEAWHKRQMGGSANYHRDSNGDYESMDVEVQWWAWVGRAALAAQQEPGNFLHPSELLFSGAMHPGKLFILGQATARQAKHAAEPLVVPQIELTQEMLDAARNAPIPAVYLDSISARQDLEFKAKFKAALSAAPKQEDGG